MLPFFLTPHHPMFVRHEEPTDGGGTGIPSDGTAAPAAEEPSSEDSPDDPPASAPSQTVPYTRFADVNRQLKAYKELGSVESIRTALTPPAAPAAPKPHSALSPEKRQALLTELESLLPGISKIPEISQQLGTIKDTAEQANERQLQQTKAAASERVAKLVSEAGYDVADAAFVEGMVANQIYTSPTLFKDFAAGDMSVVDQVWKTMHEKFFSRHLQKKPQPAPRPNLPALMRQAQGLPPSNGKGTEKSSKPMTKAEQHEYEVSAWDRLLAHHVDQTVP